jgi:ribokinase
VPGIRVHALDSTAAGDAFSGALACALARGLGLDEAVRYASLVGALSVTRLGAQPSLPTREDVERFQKAVVPH